MPTGAGATDVPMPAQIEDAATQFGEAFGVGKPEGKLPRHMHFPASNDPEFASPFARAAHAGSDWFGEVYSEIEH